MTHKLAASLQKQAVLVAGGNLGDELRLAGDRKQQHARTQQARLKAGSFRWHGHMIAQC
jgi:hypothetical protein